MRKSLSGALIALSLILFTSCITVQVSKPGRALTADNGYIAIMFINKIDPIAFSLRNVYAVLKQESGRKFYLPFTRGGELRIIEVKPGVYSMQDFVYMSGVESVKGNDEQVEVPGVLYQPPQRPGTILLSAAYPDDYSENFSVNAGEVVYIGSYYWESKFSFNESAVTINRTFDSDGSVFYAVRRDHPDLPSSMTFLSLSE